MEKKRLIGAAIGILGVALGLYWFDWKMIVVVFLMMIGNNLERS